MPVPVIALLSVVALSACDNLLSVELPGQITEESTFTPDQAGILVASAVAEIECSFSDFIATNGGGNDDVFARITGWWNGTHEFATSPNTANCSNSETSYGWFTPLHSGRWLAEQVYQRVDQEWDPATVADRGEVLAEAAIYAGLAYTQLGEYFCEVSANTGPLMTWQESLGEAESWFGKALTEINSGGDFAIPGGVTTSAEQMAYLLRARARLAKGDMSGAQSDAEQVQQGFVSYITREGGGDRKRWNRVYSSHNQAQWNSVIGPIDWWSGPPNPATGNPWPAVIPFTGYRNLGILPDGRAIDASQNPVTTDAEPTAVADPRVPVTDLFRTSNNYEVWDQEKYTSLDDDFPLAKWEEAWLIRAEVAGGQAAIDLINEIRDAHGLPQVTYLSASDTQGIEDMIIEEARRTHFLEGRFWSWKLRHDLWFPRGVGSTNYPYNYGGGVRMVMPESEYELNPNLDPSQRGSACPADQAPVL